MASLRVRAFLSYTLTDALTFGKAPDPFRGVEGDGDGDGLAAHVRQFPFVSSPCTLKVMCLVSSSSDAFFGLTELPATTEGGVVERRFPKDTRQTVGRTLAGKADHSSTSVQVSFKTSQRVSRRSRSLVTSFQSMCRGCCHELDDPVLAGLLA